MDTVRLHVYYHRQSEWPFAPGRFVIHQGNERICRGRPERIVEFEADLLDRLRERIGGAPAAVVEVAGRDSVAAALTAAGSGAYGFIVPTVAYTGTEYGDWSVVLDTAAGLAGRLSDTPVTVLETVVLGSPRWWNASCALPAGGLPTLRAASCFCVGCHMYLHAARVPLARAIGASAIVSGERLSHDGVVKASQSKTALDVFSDTLSSNGIELLMPLIDIEDGGAIERIAGGWRDSDAQMACVMKGGVPGPSPGERILRDYARLFLAPFTNSVLERFDEGARAPEYASIASGIIERLKRGAVS